MHKVSYVLFESFGFANTFRNQIAFKPIATGSARDENININIESDKTSSVSEKYKQNNPCDLQKFQAAIRYLAIKPTQQLS